MIMDCNKIQKAGKAIFLFCDDCQGKINRESGRLFKLTLRSGAGATAKGIRDLLCEKCKVIFNSQQQRHK